MTFKISISPDFIFEVCLLYYIYYLKYNINDD